ncbi:unnamed protein product [Paramecium sonneborni]|uniref:Transmembrane protein n=1 Tax=Paramecium sonneborni TaxID=65129 RepID=A0A8S1PKA8_9CILI|nr:unnamed protein product [Paramecium sonneborni]
MKLNSLYFIQSLILFIFFIPQTIGPFFYSKNAQECCDFSYGFIICSEASEILNQQQCMTDGYCKFQGITNNGAWFASALFSFLSCKMLQGIIGERRKISAEIKKYSFYIVLLTIFCNLGSCFSKFKHYGIKYDDETFFYICNLDLVVENAWMMFWWIFQLTINAFVFFFGIRQYYQLQISIKQLEIRLQENLTSIKALKIQSLHLIIILFWTINIGIKILEEHLFQFQIPFQIILFFFMFPIQLLGFCYAEFYFYSFQDHLRHNLPPCFQTFFNILLQVNIVTVCLSFRKEMDQNNDDRKSSIQSNEASLLYHHNETSAN